MDSSHRALTGPTLCQLAGLWLIIVAAKLALIAEFSSPLPFLDQWRGEGGEMLRPWLRGELTAAHLAAPFNQHRMIPSRLLALGLFEANARQWDAQVQMVVGAALHASAAVLLGALLIAGFGRAGKWAIFAALLATFALPFDWQNTLWGFQSLFYFGILFTIPALAGLAAARAGSRAWWGGVAAAVLASISLGSGGLVGFAAAGWIGLRLLLAPRLRGSRREWVAGAVALLIGGLTFALYTPAASETVAARHPASLGHFLSRLALHLSWPHSASPLLALLACSPVIFLAVLHLRRLRREEHTARGVEDLIIPLALWVTLQAAALSATRHTGMSTIVSRYMDVLALGALANFAALLRILALARELRWPLPVFRVAAIVWSLVMAGGVVPIVQRNVSLDLPSLRQMHRVQAAAVRQFLATSDPEALGGKRIFGLPAADLETLAALLRDPAIQEILPTGIGVRRTLAAAGPLSVAAQNLASGWQLVLASGVLALALGAMSESHGRRRLAAALPGESASPPICGTAS